MIYENESFLARNFTAESFLLGDSIIKSLTRYKRAWYKYFPNSFNFGINEDRGENVLLTALNLQDMPYFKNVIILCGTNNICHDSPYNIA